MQVPISDPCNLLHFAFMACFRDTEKYGTVVYGFRRLKMSETLMKNYKN